MMKKWSLIAMSLLALNACQDSSSNKTEAAPSPTPAPAASSSNTATPPTANQKVYRMATEQEFTPFIVPGENGLVTGFEADVLQAAATAQGFKIEFVPMPWKDVFPTLEEGKVDIAGSGIIMTEERMQKYDFTEPFIVAKYAAVVPEDSTITKATDLQDKRVAAIPDSAFANFAASKSKNVVDGQTIWVSIKQVMGKQADAAIVNTPIADHFVAKYPDQKLKVVAFNEEQDIPLGYALKKGNTELKNQINEGLNKIKSDGTYDKLKEKWNIKSQ